MADPKLHKVGISILTLVKCEKYHGIFNSNNMQTNWLVIPRQAKDTKYLQYSAEQRVHMKLQEWACINMYRKSHMRKQRCAHSNL